MRLRTAIKGMLSAVLLCFSEGAWAQLSCENPLEYAALAEGNILINQQIESQIRGQTETAILENVIAAEFRKIHEWEEKYSNYTQTASGFASSLNAASHIYDDALRLLFVLGKLKNAVGDNPQGILASMSMNTLYIETTTELISCFTLIRDAVAHGGKTNMLTGPERSEMLWSINDKLDALTKKLEHLALSIRYYTMLDVWNSYTAGMIDRNTAYIANTAHERWVRAAQSLR